MSKCEIRLWMRCHAKTLAGNPDAKVPSTLLCDAKEYIPSDKKELIGAFNSIVWC